MSYSKEKLINELQRVSKEHFNGNSPTKNEMFKYSQIDEIHYNRFDSWNEALRQSDLSVNSPQKSPSEEELIGELHKVLEEYCDGEVPTKKDMDNFSKFSSSTYHRIFGSWNNALEEAGYEKRKRYVPKEKILEDLNRVSEYYDNKAPSISECKEKNYFDYSIALIRQRFGSWESAWKNVGLQTHSRFDTGEDHWGWSGGYHQGYGSSWEEQKKKCLDRDDYKCRICDDEVEERWRSNPDVHHIKPVEKWDVEKEHEEMNGLDNLISLCRSCHCRYEGKWQDSYPEEFEKKVRNYLDSKDGGFQSI